MTTDYQPPTIDGINQTKRATIVRADGGIGEDWFHSYSPRNNTEFAEGPWDHWVQIAISILQHPATELVRPEAHAAVKELTNSAYYTQTGRALTDEEIERLFGDSAT